MSSLGVQCLGQRSLGSSMAASILLASDEWNVEATAEASIFGEEFVRDLNAHRYTWIHIILPARPQVGNTAIAKGKTEDLNQSNATENAIGNAGGNLISCHMLRCSALT